MPRRRFWLASFVLAVVTVAVPACRVTDLRLWQPAKPAPPDSWPVEEIRGIAYRDDPDADDLRHRLDMYLPKGGRDFPVVMLVHGGAWVIGDNRGCGLYSSVGHYLASRGIGAVLPNYRLSPGVKHPEHVRDVARAFAWTRAHIGEYGGRTDQLFVVGHSAGGHLVSLLATDERYLAAEGLCGRDIRGVVAISGVYRIPPGKVDLALGGPGPEAVRLNEVIPIRGDGPAEAGARVCLPGVPFRLDVFGPAFSDDPQVRADASPLYHVRPGLPPFLLLYADNDLPGLGDGAADFHQALSDQGGESRLVRIDRRNHNSIMFSAISPCDPAAQELTDFIRRHVMDSGTVK
jgi:acetyl esterase/lipase